MDCSDSWSPIFVFKIKSIEVVHSRRYQTNEVKLAALYSRARKGEGLSFAAPWRLVREVVLLPAMPLMSHILA